MALEEGSSGAKKKETVSSPVTHVYVWDMDETLILLKSLINGTYAQGFDGAIKDVHKGVEIGRTWEGLILQLSDDFFFYNQIEEYNMPFLDAMRRYDDGLDLAEYDFAGDGFSSLNGDSNKRKLAYRHRAIATRYKQGLRGLIDSKMVNRCNELYALTDEYTDRWLSSARDFLEQCWGRTGGAVGDDSATMPNHINVLVTSGSLIPSLVKCLLFRLDDLIPHENIYSSWEVGKTQCFRWIKERFSSPNYQFCAIGDGWEESEAAEAMRWPLVKIDPHPSGPHRFPGLTLRTLGYYLAVVYDSDDAGKQEDKL